MNEKLNEAVVSLINKSLEAFSTGVEFMAAEIPEVVQQLLIWKMVDSMLYNLLGILILVGVIYWCKWQYSFWKTEVKDRWGNTTPRIYTSDGPLSLLNLVVLIPLAAAAFIINFTWLKIWLAPKLYLIEYAASLIK